MKRSAILAAMGVFGVLLAVGGGLAWVKYRQIRSAGQGGGGYEPAESVEVVEAREVPWQATLDLVGTVLALRSVEIRNELEGMVTKVGFDSGDLVEEGRVLLVQDDSSDRAELATAEAGVRVTQAAVEVAQTRLDLARAEAGRVKSAASTSGAVSGMDVDRAQTEVARSAAEVERLKAEVQQAEARVGEIRTRIAKRTIRAPFRGRVGIRTVHEGQFLAQQMGGQGAPITTLQEVSDTIYLDFAIPQEYVSRVHVGTVVMAASPVFGSEPVPLKVVALDAAVNNVTRNIRVRTVADNRSDRLRPGMFVQVRVPVEDPKPVVVVPATAVRRASYADQVFVIVPDKADAGKMRASQRFVKLGPSLGEDVVVVSGLSAGERLAGMGSFKLREGALVMPAGKDKAAGGAGAAGH